MNDDSATGALDFSYSGYEMGVVVRHPYGEGVWLGDIGALRSPVLTQSCHYAESAKPTCQPTPNRSMFDLNSSRNSVLRCVVNMKGALPQR